MWNDGNSVAVVLLYLRSERYVLKWLRDVGQLLAVFQGVLANVQNYRSN